MQVVRVKYKGKYDKDFEGTFIKIGKEHYVPIIIKRETVELPLVISELEVTEMELMK